MMLHRVIYVSKIVSGVEFSTPTLADIVGAAMNNNRRDHLTSGMMTYRGHVIQVIEGARVDVDRLLQRLAADPRHSDLRVVSDEVVYSRRMADPLCLCRDALGLLSRAGLNDLEAVTANDAARILDQRLAA